MSDTMPPIRFARWEHGFRMHGLWRDGHRVGWVGLPNNASGLKSMGYGYGIGCREIGRRKKLAAAKSCVERRLWTEEYTLTENGARRWLREIAKERALSVGRIAAKVERGEAAAVAERDAMRRAAAEAVEGMEKAKA